MEVEIEAVLNRGAEDHVQRRVEFGDHVADAAEQAVAMRLHRCNHIADMRRIERELDAEERRGLDRDPPRPFRPQLRQHGPGNTDLLSQRIDMRPDGGGAMREGAAQAEIHPRADIRRRPVRLAVGHDAVERAQEAAIGVALARPDMALVEMDMAVDQARQHDAAVEIDDRPFGKPLGSSRQDRGDPPLLHRKVDQRQPVAVGGEPAGVDEAERQAGLRQAKGSGGRHSGETGTHGNSISIGLAMHDRYRRA